MRIFRLGEVVAVFRILRKIDCENMYDEELIGWLDRQFLVDQIEESDPLLDLVVEYGIEMEKWGCRLREDCPKSLGKSLSYICSRSTEFVYRNLVGRLCLSYAWPLFFERFPLGQIWLTKISDEWFEEIWKGQRSIAEQMSYKGWLHPQEASGLQVDNFPLDALKLMAYGIYPLILCDYIHAFSNLVFVYIPDRAFRHSQMTEGRTLYQETLWKLHHVFDDEVSNSIRGPKSGAREGLLNPIKQVSCFEWFIGQIGERMSDIVAITDPFMREQLGMTVNRAICDAHLCVTSELPYISKVFFFSCLDKLANLMTQINMENDDTTAWKRLVDPEFLGSDVLRILRDIPDNCGKYLCETMEWILMEMEKEDLSPDYLRDLRNTHHGYKLRKETFRKVLMRKAGDIHNDITLAVTPLILFFLSRKWVI